jgi:hypothetical protein
VNPGISLKTMAFNPDEFEKITKSLEQPGEIIWDESITGLYNENHGTKISKMIVMMLSQTRYKRHIYFLILPDFFVLNRNIAVTRSRALIHVTFRGISETNKAGDPVTKWDRGYFKYYNMIDKNKLFNNRKLGLEAYEVTRCTKEGNFGPFFPFDKAEYTRLKTEAINKQTMEEKVKRGSPIQKEMLIEMIRRGRDNNILWEDMATLFGCSSKTLMLYLKHAPKVDNHDSVLPYNDNDASEPPNLPGIPS